MRNCRGAEVQRSKGEISSAPLHPCTAARGEDSKMERPWGVFITPGRFLKTEIGSVQAAFDREAGGALCFGEIGAERRISIGTRVRLDCTYSKDDGNYGQTVLLKQENDHAPRITFLEEGPERVALRVLYDLLDEAGHYHGDGLQEVWMYPEGDLFLTLGLRLVDQTAHTVVRDAWFEVRADSGYSEAIVGTETFSRIPLSKDDGDQFFSFGRELPQKCLILYRGQERFLGVYWKNDVGRRPFQLDYGRPPFYKKWPHLVDQWSVQPFEEQGWRLDPSAGLSLEQKKEMTRIGVHWLRGAEREIGPRMDLIGLLALSLSDNVDDLKRRIVHHQNPFRPEVSGGEFRYYEEVDGAYEVIKTDPNGVHIAFPPDAYERTVRLKLFNLKGDGAIKVFRNGVLVQPQLVSYGDRTDDPLVPVMVHPHGSADEAILSFKLQSDGPTEVTLEETEGIHAAYQMRDCLRTIIPWRSGNAGFGDLEFSLADGKARNIRKPGQKSEAVTEHPLYWFFGCAHSPFHYLNQLRGFSIIENGPDVVRFYYESANYGDRARSEYWVSIPYHREIFRMEVKSRFTALKQWDLPTIEFYDLFPFQTIDPSQWYYDYLLFIDGIHPTRKVLTKKPNLKMNVLDFWGRCFFAFMASDRGDILTLVKNPHPEDIPMRASLCGHWIDLHLDILPEVLPVPVGAVYEVETVVEIYGDNRTSDEDIEHIARQALETGEILH